MLAIRFQRTGRKGQAQFRLVVQDSRLTPTSGKVVSNLGSYDPHTKTATIDKDKAKLYLSNGAQPSERAARLLKSEGVKLPSWVKVSTKQTGATKNPDKLRKNRPPEEKKVEEPVVADAAEPEAAVEETAETPKVPEAEATEAVEESTDEPVEAEAKPAEDTPSEEPVVEAAETEAVTEEEKPEPVADEKESDEPEKEPEAK
jgi:small subunit ribosomal protein S16